MSRTMMRQNESDDLVVMTVKVRPPIRQEVTMISRRFEVSKGAVLREAIRIGLRHFSTEAFRDVNFQS